MKPRSDSKLKTLTDERQAQIAAYARNHTLAQTVQWLAESGLTTSISATSQFLRWYRLREEIARNEQALRNDIVGLLKKGVMPTADYLSRIGNTIFAGSALDPRAWYMSQQTHLRQVELDLKAAKATKS